MNNNMLKITKIEALATYIIIKISPHNNAIVPPNYLELMQTEIENQKAEYSDWKVDIYDNIDHQYEKLLVFEKK